MVEKAAQQAINMAGKIGALFAACALAACASGTPNVGAQNNAVAPVFGPGQSGPQSSDSMPNAGFHTDRLNNTAIALAAPTFSSNDNPAQFKPSQSAALQRLVYSVSEPAATDLRGPLPGKPAVPQEPSQISKTQMHDHDPQIAAAPTLAKPKEVARIVAAAMDRVAKQETPAAVGGDDLRKEAAMLAGLIHTEYVKTEAGAQMPLLPLLTEKFEMPSGQVHAFSSFADIVKAEANPEMKMWRAPKPANSQQNTGGPAAGNGKPAPTGGKLTNAQITRLSVIGAILGIVGISILRALIIFEKTRYADLKLAAQAQNTPAQDPAPAQPKAGLSLPPRWFFGKRAIAADAKAASAADAALVTLSKVKSFFSGIYAQLFANAPSLLQRWASNQTADRQIKVEPIINAEAAPQAQQALPLADAAPKDTVFLNSENEQPSRQGRGLSQARKTYIKNLEAERDSENNPIYAVKTVVKDKQYDVRTINDDALAFTLLEDEVKVGAAVTDGKSVAKGKEDAMRAAIRAAVAENAGVVIQGASDDLMKELRTMAQEMLDSGAFDKKGRKKPQSIKFGNDPDKLEDLVRATAAPKNAPKQKDENILTFKTLKKDGTPKADAGAGAQPKRPVPQARHAKPDTSVPS